MKSPYKLLTGVLIVGIMFYIYKKQHCIDDKDFRTSATQTDDNKLLRMKVLSLKWLKITYRVNPQKCSKNLALLNVTKLKELTKQENIKDYSGMKKTDLIQKLT